MSADLSRVRFDPLRDHSGIGSLQGRVWLDADFNEQVAITDRRSRAQIADLAPTPSIVSRLTPDAFKISESGGAVSIGVGRMYVDGLPAENHGKADGFDAVLAEVNGSGTVDYTSQPYRRDVKDLPLSGGQHLFYRLNELRRDRIKHVRHDATAALLRIAHFAGNQPRVVLAAALAAQFHPGAGQGIKHVRD